MNQRTEDKARTRRIDMRNTETKGTKEATCSNQSTKNKESTRRIDMPNARSKGTKEAACAEFFCIHCPRRASCLVQRPDDKVHLSSLSTCPRSTSLPSKTVKYMPAVCQRLIVSLVFIICPVLWTKPSHSRGQYPNLPKGRSNICPITEFKLLIRKLGNRGHYLACSIRR